MRPSNRALEFPFLASANCSARYEVHKSFVFEAGVPVKEDNILGIAFRLLDAGLKSLLQGRRSLSSNPFHWPDLKAVLGFLPEKTK